MKHRHVLIGGTVAAAALILSLAQIGSLAADRGAAQAALSRGLAALDKGDVRTARVELLNAVKADPNFAAARMAQARALIALGDGAGAADEIAKARALGIRPGPGRALMAQALLMRGDAAAALAEASAPDIPADAAASAAWIQGGALLALGRIEDASHAYDRALGLGANDPRLWIDIAAFRLATGDEAGAIAAGDRAFALAPGSADVLVLRGKLARNQYGLMDALPWFRKALAVDPAHVPALTELAATLGDAGQAKDMLWATRKLLSLDPANARAWYFQAVMAARAGDYDLARAMMTRTGGRLSGEPAVMLTEAVLLMQAGSPMQAAEKLRQIVARQPQNMTARNLLAKALFDAGERQDAAIAIEPLLVRPDAGSYALTLGARIHGALGNRPVTAQLLDRAARPDMGPALAFADMGGGAMPMNGQVPQIRALMLAGRAADALPIATQLRDANPGAPGAWIVLGDVLGALDRPADAARAYAGAANIRFDRASALRLVGAWRSAGNAAAASATLSLYLAQNPADLDATRLAATLYLEAGDWDRAVDSLQALRARLGNNDAQLMVDLAWAMIGKGDAAAALPYAAHAYRLQPMNPAAADIYGWAMFRARGRGAAANDLLQQAAALAPGHRLIAQHLAQAQGRQASGAAGRQFAAH